MSRTLFRTRLISGLVTIIAAQAVVAATHPTGTLCGPVQYVRQDGAPQLQHVAFQSPHGGSAVLVIEGGSEINGATRKPISSGTVWMNSLPVFQPNAFNQNVFKLSAPVNVQEAENLMQVVLEGPPGSCMSVKVVAPADALMLQTPLPPVIVGGSLNCAARVTALGVPVEGATVLFSVGGVADVGPAIGVTDKNGFANGTLTGFQTPGSGTLNASVEGTTLTVDADFEVTAPETILAQTQGNITPGGGRVVISDVVEVEFAEDLQRPNMQVTLEQVNSPVGTQEFLDFLRSLGLPVAASEYFIRVIVSEPITGPLAVRLKVPDTVSSVLPPDVTPDIYAEAIFAGGMEVLEANERLMAVYVPERRELVGSLTQRQFSSYPPNTPMTQPPAVMAATVAAQQGNTVAAIIRVSVGTGTADVFVTGTFSQPDGTLVEAGIRDTISFDASLSVQVPNPLQWPTADHTVNSGFGSRWGSQHNGIDIPVAAGTSVFATSGGVIDANRFGWQNPNDEQAGAGYRIWINHTDGSSSGYFHLTEGSALVQPGDRVVAGQQIAKSGYTGHVVPAGVQGSHLHYEYRNAANQAVDPMPFLTGTSEDYVRQLSVMVYVNGLPMPNTSRAWTISQAPGYPFHYTASLDLTTLGFQTGEEYPLQARVLSADGQSSTIYDGTLRLRPNALRVVLRWDTTDTDVDLHVRDSSGYHSWYGDLCGIPNGCLDHDDVDGFGPETFSLPQLEPNTTYTVQLHYYSDHGNGPTTAFVQVFLDDQLVRESSVFLTDEAWGTVGTFPATSPLRLNVDAASAELLVDDLIRLEVETTPK